MPGQTSEPARSATTNPARPRNRSSTSGSVWIRCPRNRQPNQRPGVEAFQLPDRALPHRSPAVRRSLQPRVVDDDELLVGRLLDVEPQGIGAGGDRSLVGGDRVLGRDRGGPAIGHDERDETARVVVTAGAGVSRCEDAPRSVLVPRGVPPRVLGGGPRRSSASASRASSTSRATGAGRHHAEPRLVHGSHPGDDSDPPGAPLHGARAVLPDPGTGRAHAVGSRLPDPGGGGRQPGRPAGAPGPAAGRAARDLSRGRPLARRPAPSLPPGRVPARAGHRGAGGARHDRRRVRGLAGAAGVSRVRAGSPSRTTRRSTRRPSRRTPTARRGPSS